MIALEERSKSESKAIKGITFAADLSAYLLGGKIVEPAIASNHQRQLSKTDKIYSETIDYCKPAGEDLRHLKAFGKMVKVGLMKLHEQYLGRWARFPVDAIAEYGERDYCTN